MPKLPNLCRIKYKAIAALLKVIQENSEITLLKLQFRINAAILNLYENHKQVDAVLIKLRQEDCKNMYLVITSAWSGHLIIDTSFKELVLTDREIEKNLISSFDLC